jgi:hypothetical protein
MFNIGSKKYRTNRGVDLRKVVKGALVRLRSHDDSVALGEVVELNGHKVKVLVSGKDRTFDVEKILFVH